MLIAHRLVLVIAGVVTAGLLTPAAASAAPREGVPEPGQVWMSVDLADVDCVSRAVCFGVGTHRYAEAFDYHGAGVFTFVADRPLVFTKTPSGWREMSFPPIPQPAPARDDRVRNSAEMDEISCVATARPVTRHNTYCVATGRYFTAETLYPDVFEAGRLTAVWDGTRWRLRQPEFVDGLVEMPRYAVECTAARTCFALSDNHHIRPAGTTFGGFDTWNGRTWATKKIRESDSQHGGLAALSCWATRQCVAVGSRHDAPSDTTAQVVMTLRGRRWITQRPSGTWQLRAVDCFSSKACVATGRNVSLVKKPGSQKWRSVPMRGSSSVFAGVSCPAVSWCLAVGTNLREGTPSAQTYDGRQWSSATPRARQPLARVDCVSRTSCVAVGPDVLMLWNGRSWHQATINPKAAQ
jgi:hypothetical protein